MHMQHNLYLITTKWKHNYLAYRIGNAKFVLIILKSLKAMDPVSHKKVLISYIISSLVIFFISAGISMSGLFETNMGEASSRLSIELIVLTQLSVVLLANFILHGVLYYG